MTQKGTAEQWEERYATESQVWSGRVNAVLADVARGLTAGRALDLGCGEGGDAVWLAAHGWSVTAIDHSPTALQRGARELDRAGLPVDRVTWIAHDVTTWLPDSDGVFDLVTTSFLHLRDEDASTQLMRRATRWVAPGGRLLIVAHAAAPPWSKLKEHDHAPHVFATPEQTVSALSLDPDRLTVEVAEVRVRDATGPNGQQALLEDCVVLVAASRPSGASAD